MSNRVHIPALLDSAGEGDGQHDHDEIERSLTVIAGDDHHALRALRVRGLGDETVCGLSPCAANHAARAAREFVDNFPQAQLYIQLNPSPATAAIGETAEFDRLGAGHQAPVERRKWMLVDIDPIRPPEINSTEGELHLAASIARTVLDDLTEAGWPEPVVALSGNGIHLLYRIDLPADDESTKLVRDCLRALDDRHGSQEVGIDRKVFDLSRITRLYGTMNRKGDHTAERPQRLSRLLHVPDHFTTVSREALVLLAHEARAVPAVTVPTVDLRRFDSITSDQLLGLLHDVRDTPSGWLARCPAHADSTPSLSITETADGTKLLYCHAGCDFNDVVQRLGLRPSQLFGQGGGSPPAHAYAVRDEYPANLQLIQAAAYYQRCLSQDHVSYLAGQLGVSMQSLTQIGIGWSPENQAWTIPERRSDGNIIGVHLRYANGQKRMIPGSHRGLILPGAWWTWSGTVFIPEGASDVAALLTAGEHAIGRPATASAPGLAMLLLATPQLQPVVLGENDQKSDGSWPGRDGAYHVATQLAEALGRGVPVSFPPAAFKDVRDFYQNVRRAV